MVIGAAQARHHGGRSRGSSVAPNRAPSSKSPRCDREEVNPVLRALRENGIEVTALHNHMLDDEPRLFFMHFWANDDAQKLARGLAAALGHVAIATN